MLTFVLYIGVCLLYRGFRNIEVRYFEVPFCPIYFSVTLPGLKGIVHCTEDFAIERFVKSSFCCNCFHHRQTKMDWNSSLNLQLISLPVYFTAVKAEVYFDMKSDNRFTGQDQEKQIF